MDKTITLDEVIRKIEFAEPYSCEGAGEDFGKGFQHCRKWAADIVRDNREALEAGMRGTLRWKICLKTCSCHWLDHRVKYLVQALAINGVAHLIGMHYQGNNLDYIKAKARERSEKLGLTAEFVEESDGN